MEGVGLSRLFRDGQLVSPFDMETEEKGLSDPSLSLVEEDVDYSALIAAELEEEEKHHKLNPFEEESRVQHSR